MKCDIGYIYALYYKGRPFYIGQTRNVKRRFQEHKSRFDRREKLVYLFIRTITNKNDFYKDIKMKVLKVVSLYEIDSMETKYIKYCIDKKVRIYNNCVKTISYKHNSTQNT